MSSKEFFLVLGSVWLAPHTHELINLFFAMALFALSFLTKNNKEKNT